jgi:hypothetical protein
MALSEERSRLDGGFQEKKLATQKMVRFKEAEMTI